jgi:hypothetical protein
LTEQPEITYSLEVLWIVATNESLPRLNNCRVDTARGMAKLGFQAGESSAHLNFKSLVAKGARCEYK